MEPRADEAATTGAARIAEVLRRVLGDTVVGAYVYGSSVIGGLRPDSDLDVLVAVSRPVTGSSRRRLIEDLMKISGRRAADGPARPVEVTVVVVDEVVPWRFPAKRDLVYGEWLRDRFEAGWVPPPAIDPDLTVLLSTAMQHSRALIGPAAREVFEPIPAEDLRRAITQSLPELLDDLRGDERNVILTLARMWATLATGEIVPKDVAARWVLDRLPAEHRPVLETARSAYLGEQDDDWTHRTEEVDAFVRHAKAAIDNLAQCSTGMGSGSSTIS